MPTASDRPEPETPPRVPRRTTWVVLACAAVLGIAVASGIAGAGDPESEPSPVGAAGADPVRHLAWQEEVARARELRAQRLLDRLYPNQAMVTVTVELAPTVTRAQEKIEADRAVVRSRTRVTATGTRSSEYEPFVGTRETTALAPEVRAIHAVLVLDPSLGADARKRREIVDAVRGAIGTAEDGTARVEVLIEPLTERATAQRAGGLAEALPWLVGLAAFALAIGFFGLRRRPPPVREPDVPVVELPAPAPPPEEPEVAEGMPRSRQEPLPIAESPFSRYAGFDPHDLAGVLADGHPQLAAVVLAHLPPERAAEIVQALPRPLQVDVVRRVAALQRVAPDAARRAVVVLDQELERRGLVPDRTATPAGVETAAALLNLVGDLGILQEVEEADPEIAARIREEMFTFDDLTRLDGRSLQRVLGRVDARLLAMALKAAPPEVESKVFANLSRRAGTLVEEEREALGPTPRRDVDEARMALVGVVRDLIEREEIRLDDHGAELV